MTQWERAVAERQAQHLEWLHRTADKVREQELTEAEDAGQLEQQLGELALKGWRIRR